MNFIIRKDANGIEVFSPLPHKIIMLMPIFQFFHKNKPSIKSTYLGFVLFSGRQIQRFAVGEILWSIYTEIIPGEEPSRVVTVLGRGLRGTLWRLLQFYCHVIFSSAGGIDYLANFHVFRSGRISSVYIVGCCGWVVTLFLNVWILIVRVLEC